MPITLIHRQPKVEKVSPPDCALLLGIPLEEASFRAKYNRAIEGNFAQSVAVGDASHAWRAYSVLAVRFQQFVNEVEALGVQVHCTLTEQTLAECVRCRVVTIASQGRSAEFMPADIVDCAALDRELLSTEHTLEFAAHFDPSMLAQERLANHLNEILYAKMQPIGDGLGASTRKQLEFIRCRAELEAMYPTAFCGGAGIEFSDGFRELAAVAAIFPPGFDGVVDLTVCNSLVLGEMIRRRCPNALAIAMGDKTRPHLRFPLYLAVMRLLERHPDSYENAMTRLQDFFEREKKK